MNQTTFIVS